MHAAMKGIAAAGLVAAGLSAPLVIAGTWRQGGAPAGEFIAHATGRAALGVALGPVSDALAAQLGIDASRSSLVRSVEPGSTADAVGLRQYDVIVGVGDGDDGSVGSVTGAVAARRPGEALEFRVIRGGERIDIHATLGAAPDVDLTAPLSAAPDADNLRERIRRRLGHGDDPVAPPSALGQRRGPDIGLLMEQRMREMDARMRALRERLLADMGGLSLSIGSMQGRFEAIRVVIAEEIAPQATAAIADEIGRAREGAGADATADEIAREIVRRASVRIEDGRAVFRATVEAIEAALVEYGASAQPARSAAERIKSALAGVEVEVSDEAKRRLRDEAGVDVERGSFHFGTSAPSERFEFFGGFDRMFDLPGWEGRFFHTRPRPVAPAPDPMGESFDA